MAGFFRKVAGAFVEFPDGPPSGGRASPGLPDEPTSDDVAALLDQLGATGMRTAEPVASAAVVSDSPPPPPPTDALTVSPEALFEAAGIHDGPNSALRLMKILAGLAMFPPEQQLAMVRALDAADATWDESSVLSDARMRQQALRTHVDAVEAEHGRRQAELSEQARQSQAHGDSVIADIDRQIAELQALRHEALSETAQAVARIDAERRDVDGQRERARKAVAEMSDRLSSLVTFFAGQRGPNGQ